MDPKKPSSESPEERVDALVRRRERERAQQADEQGSAATADDRPAQASTEAGTSDPERRPQLTEEQRIEARRRRAEQRRRGRKSSGRGAVPSAPGAGGGASAGGNPLSRGVRATGTEIKRTAVFLAGAVVAGLDRLGPIGRVFRSGLTGLVRKLGRGLLVLRRAAATALARLGRAVLSADRVMTPRSVTIAMALVGVIALFVSQFLDFRATEIGQQGYQAVQEITSAPRRDLMTPIGAHSVLLLAVALLALAGVIGAILTGRRRFGLVVAATGVAVIVVAILIDLPKGLDVTEAEISYTGVAAILLTGFWLQLAAGATLAATGLGLAATSARSARSPDRPPRPERKGQPERSASVDRRSSGSDDGADRRSPRKRGGSVDRHESTAGSPA